MTFSVAPLNDFGRDQARYADRHDLIVIAVQDESWYIEPHQIFREISLGKGFNALVDGFVPCEHRLEPKGVAQALRNLCARPIGAIERRAKIPHELISIRKHPGRVGRTLR